MARLYVRFAVAVLSLLLVSGAVPLTLDSNGSAPAATAAAATSGTKCWSYRPAERNFFRQINGERAGRMNGLRMSKALSRVARRQTREMVSKNLLHHTPPRLLARRVTNWQILGENVGVGGTVGSLHRAFMNSPAHRDNVLHNRFRWVGVGTRRAHGRLWVTVIFSATNQPGTRLWLPSC